MTETPQEYLARKKAKGTLGTPKQNLWRGLVVYTGYCPCAECHEGEPMMVCDPDYNNCHCCNEVCS